MLKSWLVRALRISLEDNAKTLTLRHLKKAEFSASRRKQIQEEAKAGEERLKNLNPDNNESDSAVNLEHQPNTKPSVQSKLPGVRNPKRDPVGGY